MTAIDSEGVRSEQARRLAECWDESAPTPAEIRRLRARLAAPRVPARRSRFRILAVALAQGMVFGGVTLAAAAWIGDALPSFGRRPVSAPLGERASGATHDRPGGSPHDTATPAGPPLDGPAPVAAYADVTDQGTAPSDPRAASAGRPTPSNAGSSPGHAAAARSSANTMVDPARETPPPVDVPGAEEAPPAKLDGPWARVAQALSASDWLRADRTLVELAATNDPATRDAADLARAELWIAHGQGAELRSNVERLAAHGYSPLIRKRATRLLERMR